MARCQLLELCQELRDIIYEYALLDERLERNGEPKLVATNGTAGWQLHNAPPQTPTWLSLLQTGNHRLHAEVTDFLVRSRQRRPDNAEPAAAKATLVLAHPSCSVCWDCLPLPPTQLPVLDLHVKIRNIFGSAMRSPPGALAEAVAQVIERYRCHGPYLSRANPLEKAIELERVRVTLAAPEDQSCCYGNPWMQLRSHYSCLTWALGEIVRARTRAGLGPVVVEARMEGGVWESIGGKGDEKVTAG